jgi:tetratricopeptide (TPR) repeat protein
VRLNASIALAYDDYTEAIREFPGFALKYYMRGITQHRRGNYEQAVRDYADAVRLNPGFAAAYNDRAWTLYLLGRNGEALDDIGRAVTLASGNASHLGTQGHVLAALDRRQDALAAFEQAMAVADSDWIESYQTALKRHGYYTGRIHGEYDAATRAALGACLQAGCRVMD